uniref:Transcription elongation factor 1 homolog n=2 Tax=Canis lupus familiaris TaxID=9615 RepID=A0A8I3MZ12_CANLF
MGCRKSKRKPPPKNKMTGTLETQFTCPFCNHEKSCDVKMDRARNTGVISCTVCLEEFQTPITSPPRSLCPDILDKAKASRGCLGTLQPPHPPHQHLAHLNWTSLRLPLPSKACGLRFRATVPQSPWALAEQPLSHLAVNHQPLNKAADEKEIEN